jgi:NitT/TauT family transport system permease protein
VLAVHRRRGSLPLDLDQRGWTWPFVVDDTSMPHVHTIVRRCFQHPTSGSATSSSSSCLHAALFTAKEAASASRSARRSASRSACSCRSGGSCSAALPYVVASQTVPILAVAPIVVVYLGSLHVAAWFSVAVIAAYLTFFPVAINTLRGLLSTDRRAVELMRAFARAAGRSSGSCACRRRCRTSSPR